MTVILGGGKWSLETQMQEDIVRVWDGELQKQGIIIQNAL